VAWTIVFLGITLTAIVMECIAGLWHTAGTIPWTEYLARYVPWPVQLVAYVALATWLPFHFWRHDHLRQVAYSHGLHRGMTMTVANRCPSCDHTRGFHHNGTCWFTVSEGTVDADLVCPCTSPGAPSSPLTGLLRKTGAIGPDQHARVDPSRGDVHG